MWTPLVLLCTTSTALAGQSKEEPAREDPAPAEVSGELFAHVGTDLTEGAEDFTAFDLDRAYLTVKKKLGRGVAVRVTSDVGRESAQVAEVSDGAGGLVLVAVPGDDALRLYVKYAYVESRAGSGVKVRFGVAPTVYPGFYDGFWGHRFASKSFVDQAGLLETSDVGVHALGEHMGGRIDWQAAIINGAGYKHMEDGGRPSAQARLTFDPLAGSKKGKGEHLPITGVISYDMPVLDGDPVLTWVGAGGVSLDWFLAWVEVVGRTEGSLTGSGYSATAMPRHPRLGGAYVRADHWDPDTATSDDASTRMIAGLAHRFHPGVQGTLQYERTTAEATPDLPSHGVFLRTGVVF